MLRRSLKKLAMMIPPVRKVVDQRTQAVASVSQLERQIALLDSARDAQHDLVEQLQARIGVLEASQLEEFSKIAYAHWGEDAIADYLLQGIEQGRYLDVGCYHPALYSNTMALYKRGWTGVNIDPNPFMIGEYAKFRPLDTSLNIAVGSTGGSMDFYKFHDWASSNTGSASFAQFVAGRSEVEVPERTEVTMVPLIEIMDLYFSDRCPDFVNIDVEDMDIDVLASNDWSKYRPAVVAIEDLGFDFAEPGKSEIFRYMVAQGYDMISRCIYTSFFIDKSRNALRIDYTH